jgi:hypothetical protein
MSDVSKEQALLLFGLLARHGECRQAELLPKVEKADREALVKARLIRASTRAPYYLWLEDAGWAWARANLSVQLETKHQVLQDLLARLAEHLERSGDTLADFIGNKPQQATSAKPTARKTAPKKPAAPTPAALRKRIEAAYLAITGGRKNETVRLARLRAELRDLDRTTIDAALGRILKGDKKASLMRNDDPKQLDKADHDAAFSPAGEPFHVIWISS